MGKIFWLLLASMLIVGCQSEKLEGKKQMEKQENLFPDVIYGSDDRYDLHEVDHPILQALAGSTVALIKSYKISDRGDGRVDISAESFGSSRGLCRSEPFYDQPAGAFCSGFLVAEDIVVTAGHCIKSSYDCSGTNFVFDYGVKEQGVFPKSVQKSSVYGCNEVLVSKVLGSGADYAVVKLDRAVQDRSPLSIRRSGTIGVSEPLFVIGHPVGLPTKYAFGANVRSVSSEYFTANLDTYGGNSGSAVFNGRTGMIEGILVRGETDFQRNGSCTVSYQCQDSGCRGEDVTKISLIAEYIPGNVSIVNPEEPEANEPVMAMSYPDAAIPDFDYEGVYVSLPVEQPVAGRTLSVKINLKHTWIGDLSLTLIGPSGKKVKLHYRSGSSSDDIVGTFGEDLETMEDLSYLVNEPSGVWQLHVKDLANWDTGRIKSWGISIQ